jgi:hypothetical protein
MKTRDLLIGLMFLLGLGAFWYFVLRKKPSETEQPFTDKLKKDDERNAARAWNRSSNKSYFSKVMEALRTNKYGSDIYNPNSPDEWNWATEVWRFYAARVQKILEKNGDAPVSKALRNAGLFDKIKNANADSLPPIEDFVAALAATPADIRAQIAEDYGIYADELFNTNEDYAQEKIKAYRNKK